MILKNRAMERYLLNANVEKPFELTKLLNEFEWAVSPKFIETNDVILLNHDNNIEEIDEVIIEEPFWDRTDYESSFNHIHLNDYFNFNHTFQYLDIALIISENWFNALKIQHPDKSFHIVIGLDEEDCIIRVYTVRTEEVAWIDIEDLDGYSEGIMVLII